MTPETKLEMGANLGPDGVTFRAWAPRAKTLSVRIAPGHADARDVSMTAGERGIYTAFVPGLRAGADYQFVIDGDRARPDPTSRHQPAGVHGPSRVVDPRAHRWSDAGFRGHALTDFVISEIHIGTFTDEGTFASAIGRLDHLVKTGVTAVEIMPVAEFPGGRNWGYDGVGFFAPQSTYGGPEGLRQLVDACHARGLSVVLDVVYNHFGPEGNYWAEFGPYFTDKYKTPWGSAVNYDDAGSDEVRAFFVANARYWARDFHIDALRLDAIHGIFDFSARHVLSEVAEGFRAETRALGKPGYLIAESDLNDPRVIRPEARGGIGLDAQWSDDFHHAAHAAVVGTTRGYFADFGGVEHLAKALTHGFVIDGAHSRYRDRRHGAPLDPEIAGDALVISLQNHDQVANAYQGARLPDVASREVEKLLAVLFLTAPNVPMLFMGQEYGETRPFHYFTSHGDPGLAEAVRKGRMEEHAAFGGVPVDPQAESTFAESKLDWAKLAISPHRELHALYTELLALRRRVRALGAGDRASVAATTNDAPPWLTVTRTGRDQSRAFILANLGDGEAEVAVDLPCPARLVLATTEPRFGGAGPTAGQVIEAGARTLKMAGRSATILLAER